MNSIQCLHFGRPLCRDQYWAYTAPNWVSSDTLAIDALRLMEKFSITSLLLYEKDYDNSVPQGLIHIHDLIKTGIG